MATTESGYLDRRQRKTRECLHWAFVTLLAQKPYAEITVDDITTTADVARTTFYAHYRDKAALLDEATRELLDSLEHQFAAITWADARSHDANSLCTLFLHVDRHCELYRLIISGEGGAGPRSALVTALRNATAGNLAKGTPDGTQPRLPVQLVTTAFVGALLATMEAWLNGDIEMEPSLLATNLMRQQVDGMAWGLGFESGQMACDPLPTTEELRNRALEQRGAR